MAIDERDISKILGNQRWMKDALGELLATTSAIATNQTTQITQLTAIKGVLDKLEAQLVEEEALKELQAIRQTLDFMLAKM